MSLYIATNRNIKDGQIDTDGKVSGSQHLRFATYNNKKSQLIPDYDQKDWMNIDYREPEALQRGSGFFFKKLYDEMVETQKDTLFYIHGYGNEMSDSYKFIDRLEVCYGKKSKTESTIGPIVLFSWPTNGQKLTEYENDRKDIPDSAMAIFRFIMKLEKFLKQYVATNYNPPCNQKIHMMVHSMGNQLFEESIRILNKEINRKFEIFGEVILTGADISTKAFAKMNPLYKLSNFCERAHIYIHRQDRILALSLIVNDFVPRIGRRGPHKTKGLPPSYVFVDVTETYEEKDLVDDIINHRYHIFTNEVIKDMNLVLAGKTLDELDKIHRKYKKIRNIWKIKSSPYKK